MPELPEVETTRRGIAPWILNQTITHAVMRRDKLRWPVPNLTQLLPGNRILDVQRRAKYLLIQCSNGGTLIIHLGMSGSLRILPNDTPAQTHDHIDIQFDEKCLRMRDPRRFGAVLWSENPLQHPLIKSLGPEPLSDAFNPDYLWQQARQRKIAIKNLLMNGHIVVGVGNIYATESLFMAGIHPKRRCDRIAYARLADLVDAVKKVLALAIQQGGTTLRDFQREDGKPGYFRHALQVYGREGENCLQCGNTLKSIIIGQRTSTYCNQCQR